MKKCRFSMSEKPCYSITLNGLSEPSSVHLTPKLKNRYQQIKGLSDSFSEDCNGLKSPLIHRLKKNKVYTEQQKCLVDMQT